MIEAILVTSEPFQATPDMLRAIAIQFAAWADEADELAKKTTSQPT